MTGRSRRCLLLEPTPASAMAQDWTHRLVARRGVQRQLLELTNRTANGTEKKTTRARSRSLEHVAGRP